MKSRGLTGLAIKCSPLRENQVLDRCLSLNAMADTPTHSAESTVCSSQQQMIIISPRSIT